MRMDFITLEKIKDKLGDFQLRSQGDNKFSFKFGYWRRVSVGELNDILPMYLDAEEEIIDEDEDCGQLFSYTVSRNNII